LAVSIWAVYAGLQADTAPSRFVSQIAAGSALAVLSLVRPSFGLLVLPAAIGLALNGKAHSLLAKTTTFLVVIVAFATVLSPWLIRSYSVSHKWLPFGASGGASLYRSAQQYKSWSLSPWLTDAEVGRVESTLEREDRLAQEPRSSYLASLDRSIPAATRVELASDHSLTQAALRVVERLGIRRIAQRIPEREVHLWATADYPPRWALTSVLHRIGQAQWAVLIFLSMIGLSSSRYRWRDLWPLLAVPIYLSCVHLVYHVESRYSIPARPLVIILSGMGAVWLWTRRIGHPRPPGPGDRLAI
jgi:hypothetical protein